MDDRPWFFTAPEEPVLKRRGDPLGFRQDTDNFADLLAPGLSNRTVDARWLTILCWTLRNAYEAWQHFRSGNEAVRPGDSRQAATGLYGWIRPLELLWIDRAKHLLNDKTRGYQLPGIRAIQRWRNNPNLKHFGLSRDQLRRYRQTGIYGAYRVALRRLKGLTMQGDGWTVGVKGPGPELATIVDKNVNWKPFFPERQNRKGRKPNEEIYCQGRVWREWRHPGKERFLPESLRCVRRLPPPETKILRRVVFGVKSDEVDDDAKRRSRVVGIINKTNATSHAALCADIAKSLRHDLGDRIAGLKAFSVLADAGVDAMNAIWRSLEGESQISVSDCAKESEIKKRLAQLSRTADRWKSLRRTGGVSGLDNADALAEALCKASKSPPGMLQALITHHVERGGGLRWFWLSPDKKFILRVARDRPYGGTMYRFRLAALSRMAVQCGHMPALKYRTLFDTSDELDEDQEVSR